MTPPHASFSNSLCFLYTFFMSSAVDSQIITSRFRRDGTENATQFHSLVICDTGRVVMKKIEAVIRPSLLGEVKDALKDIGIYGMTITDALGASKREKPTLVYRMTEYKVEFVPMLKLEMVLDDDEAEAALAVIFSAARTGQPGDGRVWVSSLDAVARIRTGEWNANAV